jgi:pilus assembly protein CpaD
MCAKTAFAGVPWGLAVAGIVVACLAVGGCKTDAEYARLSDPALTHPIIVSQRPRSMEVRVGRQAHGLTGEQRADITAFADRSRASDAGNSKLVIAVPSGAANEVAAMYAVGEIRQILSERGFSDASIAVEGYRSENRRNPPIHLSYLQYVAQAPDCGTWPTNLARERENTPYLNYGCANQHNLAAMIANPADLLGPRTEGDRVSERRDAVWDKYVAGESTTAKKGEDEKVKVESGN